MYMKRIFICACVFYIAVFSSCSVQQNITLQIDGAGSSQISAELHPVFMKYYNDLASGFISSFDPANPKYFDLDGIRDGFRRNPELQIAALETPQPGRLNINFKIKNISEAIKNQDPQIQNVISRSKSGSKETLRIYVDKKNLASILRMIPQAESPAVKMLLPSEEISISEEEYCEHLAWALEDYAANEKIEDVLKSSAVNLTIKTPRKILSQTGGKLKSETEVIFTVSVLRLFTLEKPVEFSVSY